MSQLKLKDLLEDLADDGVAVSSGSFTLDPAKAEEKLKSFGFAESDDFILKIIQFAVASHAGRILIESTSTKLAMAFDGDEVSPDDYRNLMAHLINESHVKEHRRFRHLAAGLRGAAAVDPSSVSLQYWNGESGFQRIWDSKGWRSENFTSTHETAFHHFVLTRSVSQSFSSAGQEIKSKIGLGNKLTPEEMKIQVNCLHSPTELVLEGNPLKRAEFGRRRYPGYDISQDPNPGESRPPTYVSRDRLIDELVDPEHHYIEWCYPSDDEWGLASPASEATIRKGVLPGEDKPCKAWLGLRASLAEPEVTFVEDGVTLQTKKLRVDCPGLVAVMSAHNFSKDLTGFKIVKDDLYRKEMDWLELEALKIRKLALDSLALFPTRKSLAARLGKPT